MSKQILHSGRSRGGRRNGVYAVAPTARSPLSRPCPRCEAQPGQSCRRWIAGRVQGEDVGGGYWTSLKSVHPQRRARRAGGAA